MASLATTQDNVTAVSQRRRVRLPYDRRTCKMLRDELARRGLKKSGKKADLVARLKVDDEAPPATSGSGEDVDVSLAAVSIAGTPPLQRSGSRKVPEPEDVDLMCPISQDLFEDPVVASDGHTYSRTCIERWMNCGQRSSPVTRERLEITVYPNRLAAKQVQNYKVTLGLKLIELIERCPNEPACEFRARDILDEAKADLNARRERDRRTPLLVAAELGLRGLVDALVDNGADYNATDSDGKDVEYLLPELREEREAREKAKEEEARRLAAERKKTGFVDWDAVERVVGKEAADQMKQGEGFTGELGLNYKSITAEGLRTIAPALRTMPNLKSLNLNDNNIGDEGCRTIAPALRTMINLKSLYLHDNNIGDDSLAVLCSRVLPEISLEYLDLNGNKIGNVGCQSLLELVNNGSLRSLNILGLSRNPNISSELKEVFKRDWKAKGKNPRFLFI